MTRPQDLRCIETYTLDGVTYACRRKPHDHRMYRQEHTHLRLPLRVHEADHGIMWTVEGQVYLPQD